MTAAPLPAIIAAAVAGLVGVAFLVASALVPTPEDSTPSPTARLRRPSARRVDPQENPVIKTRADVVFLRAVHSIDDPVIALNADARLIGYGRLMCHELNAEHLPHRVVVVRMAYLHIARRTVRAILHAARIAYCPTR